MRLAWGLAARPPSGTTDSRKRRAARRSFWCALAATALLAAGCGSGDDQPDPAAQNAKLGYFGDAALVEEARDHMLARGAVLADDSGSFWKTGAILFPEGGGACWIQGMVVDPPHVQNQAALLESFDPKVSNSSESLIVGASLTRLARDVRQGPGGTCEQVVADAIQDFECAGCGPEADASASDPALTAAEPHDPSRAVPSSVVVDVEGRDELTDLLTRLEFPVRLNATSPEPLNPDGSGPLCTVTRVLASIGPLDTPQSTPTTVVDVNRNRTRAIVALTTEQDHSQCSRALWSVHDYPVWYYE